jgi:dTDP-4-dehydrorhamnose 3,5-epimerase
MGPIFGKFLSAAKGTADCLMEKIDTKIHDAYLLKPKVFGDARGFFLESWNRETFRALGIDFDFVQDNHSRSAKHVLRGLHYQAGNAAQGKLVWVTSGTVFDVLVDLRKSSPTYGVWDGYYLTAEAHERIWVPPGCAHGFLVVSDTADFHYKVSAPYRPDAERSLLWNDADLAINWPQEIGIKPIVSQKDAEAATFQECEKYEV